MENDSNRDVDILYAPPQTGWDDMPQATDESGLSVEGKTVISPKDHTWPDRCVVCNAPANGFKLKRKMFWHHPAIYLLILISWIIYLIVALIVRKNGTIHVGLCEQHRARRRNGILIGWLGFLGSLILSIASGSAGVPYLILLGFAGIITFAVIGIIMARVAYPKRIDDTKLWVITGEPFRNSIQ